MSGFVLAVAWIPAEDDLLLSLIHKGFLGGHSTIHRSWDEIAAYMNLVPSRDADNTCYRRYTPDNVCSRYYTVLKPKIQELTLLPIKEGSGMAQPYVDFQGTEPIENPSEDKDFVLFPRTLDCRLEPEEELLGNKQ